MNNPYIVDGVHYPSEEYYNQFKETEARYKARFEANPSAYPPCDLCEFGLGCDCARSTILYLEDLGADHNTAVSIAAIDQATMIRQYDFDDHDDSFEDYQKQFVEAEGETLDNQTMADNYAKWVAENQPAVQWAIDFADLRSYL